ncbi:MAG: serine/threonine protein kinase, partial [Polyangiales bacterium]
RAGGHGVGVVHRDLTPETVCLAPSRRAGASFTVKVLDFGIAKVIAEARSAATAAVGTPLFMAPEQTSVSRSIGPSTDVWALGLIVYRLLTGRFYWRTPDLGGTLLTLFEEVTVSPLERASVRAKATGCGALLPAGFDDWFALCVARDPGVRFSTAGAAWAALETVLREQSVSAATRWLPAHYPQQSSSQRTLVSAQIASIGEPSIDVDLAELSIESTSEAASDRHAPSTRSERPPTTLFGAPIPRPSVPPSPLEYALRTGERPMSRRPEIAHALEEESLHRRFDAAVREGNFERAACIAGVLVALDKADRRELAQHDEATRRTPRFRASLGEASRRLLLGCDRRDILLDSIAATITPAARRLRAGVADAALAPQRLRHAKLEEPRTSISVIGSTFFGVARVLSLEPPRLFVDATAPGRLEALAIDPPTSVACAGVMTGIDRRELAFFVGEHMMLYRPGDYLRVICNDFNAIEALLFAAIGLVIEDFPVPSSTLGLLAEAREALDASLRPSERERLVRAVTRWAAQRIELDVVRYVHASLREGARAGLLACADVATAARLVIAAPDLDTVFRASERLADLLAYAVSEQYLAARATCGLAEP